MDNYDHFQLSNPPALLIPPSVSSPQALADASNPVSEPLPLPDQIPTTSEEGLGQAQNPKDNSFHYKDTRTIRVRWNTWDPLHIAHFYVTHPRGIAALVELNTKDKNPGETQVYEYKIRTFDNNRFAQQPDNEFVFTTDGRQKGPWYYIRYKYLLDMLPIDDSKPSDMQNDAPYNKEANAHLAPDLDKQAKKLYKNYQEYWKTDGKMIPMYLPNGEETLGNWDAWVKQNRKSDKNDKANPLRDRMSAQLNVFFLLVHNAQRGEPVPWDCLARAWDSKTMPIRELHFVFIVPEFVCFSDSSELDTRSTFTDIINEALRTLSFKPTFRIHLNALPANLEPMVCIGYHLMNLYQLHVTPAVYVELKAAGLVKDRRPFFSEKHYVEKYHKDIWGTSPVTPTCHDTWTILNYDKVNAASLWAKDHTRNQSNVMGKIGPRKLAKDHWNDPTLTQYKHSAEWLHRSAYSFGGPKGLDAKVDDSQVKENLILGTYETNTVMMRYENTAKRVMRHIHKVLETMPGPNDVNDQPTRMYKPKVAAALPIASVDTTLARLDPDELVLHNLTTAEREVYDAGFDNEGRHIWPWLPLKLTWTYKLRYNSAGQELQAPIVYTYNFYPFLRQNPMRLELELDEAVEQLYFSDRNDLQAYTATAEPLPIAYLEKLEKDNKAAAKKLAQELKAKRQKAQAAEKVQAAEKAQAAAGYEKNKKFKSG